MVRPTRLWVWFWGWMNERGLRPWRGSSCTVILVLNKTFTVYFFYLRGWFDPLTNPLVQNCIFAITKATTAFYLYFYRASVYMPSMQRDIVLPLPSVRPSVSQSVRHSAIFYLTECAYCQTFSTTW